MTGAGIRDRWAALPETVFSDPQVLDRELRALFHGSWQIVCTDDRVPSVGDLWPFRLFGREYILSRSGEDRLEGFENRCPHKGNRLIRRAANRRRIICPFHGWAFDLKGRRLPPKKESLTPTELDACSLTPLRLTRQGGLVLADVRGTAPAPDSGALADGAGEVVETSDPRNWKTVMAELLNAPSDRRWLYFPNLVVRAAASGLPIKAEQVIPEAPGETRRLAATLPRVPRGTGEDVGTAGFDTFAGRYLDWIGHRGEPCRA